MYLIKLDKIFIIFIYHKFILIDDHRIYYINKKLSDFLDKAYNLEKHFKIKNKRIKKKK